MPEIYEGFGLVGSERLLLSKEAVAKVATEEKSRGVADDEHQNGVNFPLELPHPTSTLAQDVAKLGRLYEMLSEGLSRFIQGLAQWDDAAESQRDRINAILRELPKKAAEAYKSQYLALCVD
jgi:hypothetical protein